MEHRVNSNRAEQKKQNKTKNYAIRFRELSNIIKHNICFIGYAQEKGTGKLSKEIMVENFPILEKKLTSTSRKHRKTLME